MKRQLWVPSFLVFTFWSVVAGQFGNNEGISFQGINACRTPSRRIGVCVRLEDCPPLKNLVDDGLSFRQIMFLQLSICRVENGFKFVCCAKGAELVSSQSDNNQNGYPAVHHGQVPSAPGLSPTPTPPAYVSRPLVTLQPVQVPQLQPTTPAVEPEEPSQPELGPAEPPKEDSVPESDPYESGDVAVAVVNPVEADRPAAAAVSEEPRNKDDVIAMHRNFWMLPEDCGETLNVGDRIVNGQTAPMGVFPWMSLISYTNKKDGSKAIGCGGSLISSKYVLTAAHCVVGLEPYQIEFVRLGEYDTRSDIDCQNKICAPKVQDIPVAKVLYHPKYDETSRIEFDVALLKLSKAAELNNYVWPVCLPQGKSLDRNLPESKTATVSGWGRTDPRNEKNSPILQFVIVPVTPESKCQATYVKHGLFGNSRFCAGGEKGKDSCKGDSGGPLTDLGEGELSGKIVQYGVVSAGPESCSGETPALYTNVTYFMPWILENMEA